MTTTDPYDPAALRQRAEQGDALAQHDLGLIYRAGDGVPKDEPQAMMWFRKAADQGVAEAQYNLGLMYFNGEGVVQDFTQAVAWYRRAADQGHAAAQYNLGFMYDRGQGVPQDDVEGHKWRNLAASRVTGDKLKEYAETRDRLAIQLIPSQLAEAQKRAAEWQAAYEANLLAGPSSVVPNSNFFVANDSDQTVFYIYVSAVDSGDWGSDKLGDDVLSVADRFPVVLPRDGRCQYDVRVVYGDGATEERRNQDVCAISEMAFSGADAQPPPDPVTATPTTSFGTGFFVSAQGYALTNNHVTEDCRSIDAHLDGRRVTAQLVRQDETNDLALLRVQAPGPVAFARFRARPARSAAAEGILIRPEPADTTGCVQNVPLAMPSLIGIAPRVPRLSRREHRTHGTITGAVQIRQQMKGRLLDLGGTAHRRGVRLSPARPGPGRRPADPPGIYWTNINCSGSKAALPGCFLRPSRVTFGIARPRSPAPDSCWPGMRMA